jgi:HlyD family secretion protein
LDSTKKQEYESAVQSVRDAEVALKDVLVLQQQRAGSQASVDQIQSSLSESMRLLGETEVRAPISGVVTRRFVQAGELVNAVGSFSAGSPIVKIEDRTKMLVRLEINEIDVARLDLEMRSDITVDALPGSEFTGRVTKISPAQIENAAAVGGDPVVKYEVEVTLDRVDKGLKSGMSAKCEMVPESASDVLRLPVAYLGEDSSGFFVMMYDDKEVPKPLNPGEKDSFVGQRKEITIGIRDLTYVEVTSGVKEGDQVVRPKFTGPARKGMMSFGPGDDEDEEDADAKKDKSSEERKSDENKKKDPEQSGGGE